MRATGSTFLMKIKINATKPEWVFIGVFLFFVIAVVPAGFRFMAKLEEEKTQLVEEEANLLTTILQKQQNEMRTMAYHQAVAQLEQKYPVEYRYDIDATEWEAMLSERTEAILNEATYLSAEFFSQ